MTKRIETTTYQPRRSEPTALERKLGVVRFDELEGEAVTEEPTTDLRTRLRQ